MTAKTKKPAAKNAGKPGAAARAKKPPAAPPPPPPIDETKLSNVDRVRLHCTEIMIGVAEGMSLREVGEAMDPPMGALALRSAINGDTELFKRWKIIQQHRAHHMVEEAAIQARKLANASMAKEAADVYLKVAAKIAPELYGDKSTVALTGGDGGPVQSLVTMSPADAYKSMLRGPAK